MSSVKYINKLSPVSLQRVSNPVRKTQHNGLVWRFPHAKQEEGEEDTMIRLLFEIKPKQIWKYDCEKFYIDLYGIYHFTDIRTGRTMELHNSLYRGKEVF